jgi:glyoxylase-like metal-dependent hydrolase (beta-lactamase superfamily II)
VKEILPGLYHWMADHPKIGFPVSSYYLADSGTVLDPMVPPDAGLAWFDDEHPIERIALTNRHHDREASKYCAAFELEPVLVPESGLYEVEDRGFDIRGYVPGEEIAPGILAHDVGAICPDDMALEIRAAGALAMADGLVHFEEGIGFVRDSYMDNPAETKRGLVSSLEELLDVDFDTLLFAHGTPIVGGAKKVLRDFLASGPAD